MLMNICWTAHFCSYHSLNDLYWYAFLNIKLRWLDQRLLKSILTVESQFYKCAWHQWQIWRRPEPAPL